VLVTWVRRLLGLLALAMLTAALGSAFLRVDRGERDCGAPAAFLAEGRVDPPDQPPCRDAAADRVARSLVLLGGAAVAAIAWAAVADGTESLRKGQDLWPALGDSDRVLEVR
jgi:hypothetical protein